LAGDRNKRSALSATNIKRPILEREREREINVRLFADIRLGARGVHLIGFIEETPAEFYRVIFSGRLVFRDYWLEEN